VWFTEVVDVTSCARSVCCKAKVDRWSCDVEVMN
jgi:hypothetical protein